MSNILIMTLTYNREGLLPRTIESVLSQTFTEFEYIIVDNGSTDNTRAVLEKYSAKDSRISVITRPQNDMGYEYFAQYQSILKSRNVPYHAIIDDDDFMEQTAVEILHGLITEYN